MAATTTHAARRGPRRRLAALAAGLSAALAATCAAAPASAAPPPGLPEAAPPAARAAEPRLPKPRGWSFGEQFPRTSGTGRYAGGAFLWSDFIYDDHGAAGPHLASGPALLAAPHGTYRYPQGPAQGNGADVFRVGIGSARDGSSVWRIDWNTMIDPDLPIATFALDTDRDERTGTEEWPAGSGLRSPGIDRFLTVSSRGAWLTRAGGRTTRVARPGRGLTVDTRARSFVVRVAARDLRTAGTWRVRLAAGLADGSGRAFRPVGSELGGGGSLPAAYNLGIRPHRTEDPVRNFWMERSQAEELKRSNATPFFVDVSWRRLARRERTREPQPRGYTNRWYVSSISPGQGVGESEPVFRGRVQPYAVHVPLSWRKRGRPSQLVWMLHSLGVQHNQYGALNPRFVRAACERPRRICATTLGRGPGGWYTDAAELDFWEVWASIARSFRLDPRRTNISGYSMGGFGSYKLGLLYPHAFARGLVLAGPPASGLRIAPGIGATQPNSDTRPLLANGRASEWFVAHGALDQLVPVTSVLDQVGEMDRLGLRYTFELYPAEDHLLYAIQDGFSTTARAINRRTAPRNPASFDYRWYPRLVDRRLGIGPRSAWWVTRLSARAAADDEIARVRARTFARREHAVTSQTTGEPILGTDEKSPGGGGLDAFLGAIGSEIGQVPDLLNALVNDLLVNGDPAVGLRVRGAWQRGARSQRRPRVALELEGVRALTIDRRRAGLRRGERFRVTVVNDAPARLTLTRLAPGTRLRAGGRQARAGAAGRATIRLRPGERTVRVG